MTKYKIERNVPMPAHGLAGRLKYPLDILRRGESFTAEIGVPSMRTTIYNFKRKNPELSDRMFKARTVKGITRVWRTA